MKMDLFMSVIVVMLEFKFSNSISINLHSVIIKNQSYNFLTASLYSEILKLFLLLLLLLLFKCYCC